MPLDLRACEDLFESIPDGMAVLDAQGCALVLNPAGRAILGAQRGADLSALLRTRGDVVLVTRDGRRVTVSASASRSEGRTIVTFRDVTEERAVHAELRKTTEFLERLIDATVDGIVAADLRGRVLVFNKGAERVTGWSAAELVGRRLVGDLYQPGDATEIMRRLRAARSSGEGRIGPLRLAMVAKSGEIVPVDLSVALVVEGGRETATVGVFRDLREQLRVEQELQVARERLAVTELAGAAAHELNQPLTSVLGYSELLYRRTQEHEKGREELAAIVREAVRMAEIVRKIGKITRVETQPYVAGRRIIDLDRSS